MRLLPTVIGRASYFGRRLRFGGGVQYGEDLCFEVNSKNLHRDSMARFCCGHHVFSSSLCFYCASVLLLLTAGCHFCQSRLSLAAPHQNRYRVDLRSPPTLYLIHEGLAAQNSRPTSRRHREWPLSLLSLYLCWYHHFLDVSCQDLDLAPVIMWSTRAADGSLSIHVEWAHSYSLLRRSRYYWSGTVTVVSIEAVQVLHGRDGHGWPNHRRRSHHVSLTPYSPVRRAPLRHTKATRRSCHLNPDGWKID